MVARSAHYLLQKLYRYFSLEEKQFLGYNPTGLSVLLKLEKASSSRLCQSVEDIIVTIIMFLRHLLHTFYKSGITSGSLKANAE